MYNGVDDVTVEKSKLLILLFTLESNSWISRKTHHLGCAHSYWIPMTRDKQILYVQSLQAVQFSETPTNSYMYIILVET